VCGHITVKINEAAARSSLCCSVALCVSVVSVVSVSLRSVASVPVLSVTSVAVMAGDVENLWTIGAFPVHSATPKIFFDGSLSKTRPRRHVHAVSSGASLDIRRRLRRMRPAPGNSHVPSHIVIAAIHRFEESIAGRDYLIEVSLVAKDRWRAYIVRVPAVPTALMPFYGRTPMEAARQLSDWLTRAHVAANPAGTG
jgi:hypothetical protein